MEQVGKAQHLSEQLKELSIALKKTKSTAQFCIHMHQYHHYHHHHFLKVVLEVADKYLGLLNFLRVEFIMLVNSGLLFRTLIFCLVKQASILQQECPKNAENAKLEQIVE